MTVLFGTFYTVKTETLRGAISETRYPDRLLRRDWRWRRRSPTRRAVA